MHMSNNFTLLSWSRGQSYVFNKLSTQQYEVQFISLVKTMNTNMKTIFHPYEMRTTNNQVHFLVVVGLLLSFEPLVGEPLIDTYCISFLQCLHSFLDCCLCLDQYVDFFNQVPQMFFRKPSLFSLPSRMLGFSTHWAASHTWAKAVSPKNHC